ncbi:MAG: hypothetical protein ABI760_20305 [Ferruginibacter sp.]
MLVITITSCQKLTVEIIQVGSSDIVISTDTTIYGVWDIKPTTIIRFETGGHVSGTGIINGGILAAPLTMNIFDTTITLVNTTLYNKDFSVMWYGAGSTNTDNYNNIQKSISTCIANGIRNCFVPKGNYTYSKSLKIMNVYKSTYVAVGLRFYGESEFWDDKTSLIYNNDSGFALGIQLGKGAEIDHLKIMGKFLPPETTGIPYYNTPLASYGVNLGNYGLVIDYDGTNGVSGSTGVKVHDMWVSNFDILYSVSPNGVTSNGDILKFENIRCGDGRIGFQSNQAQEKGNSIQGIYSWGSIHTLISIGQSGKYQAGNYTIDGGNIAGKCIRLFDIREAGWYPSYISNIFSESIASIGSIQCGDSNNQLPTKISSSTFHFAGVSEAGVQNLVYCNSTFIKFEDCLFRYYGNEGPLIMTGWATFENCFFSGPIQNVNNGFVFK